MAPPRIITARSMGLTFQNLFGQLGPETHVTGHYSAGQRARDWKQGVERAKSFHAFHKGPERGWGGIAYHYLIADDGALILGRPTILKGAHTGLHNTSNIGVNCPGTTGDKPTEEQKATYQWLLENAHTDKLPKAHRTDRNLAQAQLHGHKSWQGHTTNGCPGLFLGMFVAGLSRDVPPGLDEEETEGRGDYPEPSEHGTTVADHRSVSPEEAEEAKNTDEADDELPEADPDFDEDLGDLAEKQP